jgi:hypothetical protein
MCDVARSNPSTQASQGTPEGKDDKGHLNALSVSHSPCVVSTLLHDRIFSPVTKIDKTMEIFQMHYTITASC